MEDYKTFYQWSGEDGLLINQQINLKEKVSYTVKFDLIDINRDNLINISVKMPGSAINSPYEIPYENYILEFTDNNITYIVKNMLMNEWKEVYLYSYNFKFSADNISSEFKEKADYIEFLIPNLIIGYDGMIMRDGIINQTKLEINYKNKDYKIILEANPEFNNNKNFSSLESGTNFTSKICFDLKDSDVTPEEVKEVFNELIFLISIAYGNYRPAIMTRYYKDDVLINQEIKDNSFTNDAKPLGLIPYQYSGILSGFINSVFPYYSNLTDNEKKYIKGLASLIFQAKTKISFPESFVSLDKIYQYANIADSHFSKLNNEYQEGDYKTYFQEITKFNKILLSQLNYSGKYFDYSGIIPVIQGG